MIATQLMLCWERWPCRRATATTSRSCAVPAAFSWKSAARSSPLSRMTSGAAWRPPNASVAYAVSVKKNDPGPAASRTSRPIPILLLLDEALKTKLEIHLQAA